MKTNGYLSAPWQLCCKHGMIPPGSTVLCAVSGGADSICLLHWLSCLRERHPFTLVAAHYDHNLRGERSHADAQFVARFTAALSPHVTLLTGSGQVASEAARTGRGIEETAREMRYAFLQQAARETGAELIATAHNANDNAETMLLNLMRGCGLNGLTGIPPRRDNIIRPLLTTTRPQIEAYLAAHGLDHVEDASNGDDTYTRNRVRHQLIPVLEQLCPDFIRQTTQTAARLAADEAVLMAQAQQALDRVQSIDNGLSIPVQDLARLSDPLAVRGVRLLLTRLRGTGANCTAAHLQAVADLCRSDRPSARVDLPQGILARRVYDRLELVLTPPEPSFPPQSLSLPGTLRLAHGTLTAREGIWKGGPVTPYAFPLSRSLVSQGVTVRSRAAGDRLKRPGRRGASVKKIMIDEKLPRHMRDSLPVLEQNGQIVAVAGLGPDTAFFPDPGQPCWHILYTPAQTERNDTQ